MQRSSVSFSYCNTTEAAAEFIFLVGSTHKNGSKLSFVSQPSHLDSKTECLQLTMTEVLKRQNSKSKKGFNQVSETLQDPLPPHNPAACSLVPSMCYCKLAAYLNLSSQTGTFSESSTVFFSSLQQLNLTEVKVDKVQVSGAGNTTFAVCLDQDEKKVLQSVTRSE